MVLPKDFSVITEESLQDIKELQKLKPLILSASQLTAMLDYARSRREKKESEPETSPAAENHASDEC